MFTTRRGCALRHVHGAGSPEQFPRHSEDRHPLEGVMGHLRTLSAQEGGGVPFASISPALGLRGGHSTDPMKEAKTGVEFPETYCHLSRKDCPKLMGIGCANNAHYCCTAAIAAGAACLPISLLFGNAFM